MSDEDVIALTDALPTGYQAAEMCNLTGGETVVVFGAGPVGLFAMKSAWLLGAGRVVAVDKVGYRLEFARRWAGAETLDFESVDVIAAVKELTDGRGADACIDAVGLRGGRLAHAARGRHLREDRGRARRPRSTGASTRRARAGRSRSSACTGRRTTSSTSAPR